MKEIMKHYEKRMLETLAEKRKKFSHSGIKGSGMEYILREFLKEYLPRKYEVAHGEIIDSYENRSRETDIIILNDDHPFLIPKGEDALCFIEGVSAAGEVKMILNSQHFNDSMVKAMIFKSLQQAKFGAKLQFGSESKNPNLFKPPYFIFAYESKIKIETIYKKLIAFKNEHLLEYHQLPDGIFTLNRGSLFNQNGVGRTSDIGLADESGNQIEATTPFTHSTDSLDAPLFDFMAWLTIAMPPPRIRSYPILTHYFYKNRIHWDNHNPSI